MKNTCFVTLLTSALSFAVPGLEGIMKELHPEMQPACTTCHEFSGGAKPSNSNVTKAGRAYYIEVLETKRFDPKAIVAELKRTDFIVFGDSRSNLDINKKVVDKICSYKPQAVFHTGDMVADGAVLDQWKAVLPIHQCLIEPKILYHSCGNHEAGNCVDNPVRKALGNTNKFYLKEFKGLTFVALDSHTVTGEELQWLGKLPNGKAYIPFFHHPPFPTMSGHAGEPIVIKEFIPRLQHLGVKLVFTGHNHGYDRAFAEGIHWVTSGGGGAPLYPCGPNKSYTKACLSDYHFVRCQVDGKKVSCIAELLDGKVIDSFSVDSQ